MSILIEKVFTVFVIFFFYLMVTKTKNRNEELPKTLLSDVMSLKLHKFFVVILLIMKEIANTADDVYSASLSCEVCNQLMEPLVPTLPIRRPNCLSHSSPTLAPFFLLPFFLPVYFYHSRGAFSHVE